MERFAEAITFELCLQGSACSFNKHLLNTYYIQSSILGAGDRSMNKTKIPALMEFIF